MPSHKTLLISLAIFFVAVTSCVVLSTFIFSLAFFLLLILLEMNKGRRAVKLRSARAPAQNATTENGYPKTYGAYKILKELGEGSFAKVHLAHPRGNSDNRVALKIVEVGF